MREGGRDAHCREWVSLSRTRKQFLFNLKHEVFVCVSNVKLTFNDPNVLQGVGNLHGLKL